MKLKALLLLAVVSGIATAMWPATGSAATYRGIVVVREHGTMLVASPTGLVRAVRGSAAVGARVVVGAGRATVVGRASKAHIRGIVVRRTGATLFVSSNRHLLALHTARVLAGPAPAAPGTIISAQVGIANGQLAEQDEDDVGQVATGTITVQATVAAVGTGSVTLTVEGQTLTVSLPGGLGLPASLVGQTVTIQLSVAGLNDDQGDDHGGGGGGDGGNHGGGDGGGDD